MSHCVLSGSWAPSIVAMGPFLVDMAHDLNTTVPLLGQVTTISVFFGALVGLVAGPLADHYGHRRLLLVGVACLTFSGAGVIVADSFTWLVLARLLAGIGGAILPGVSLAIAGSRFYGEERRKAMSWTVAAIASPVILGLPVLAVIGDYAGWRYAFGVVALVNLACLVLVRIALPDDAVIPEESFRLRTIANSYRLLLHHRPTLTILGASAFRAVCWVGAMTYLSAYLIEDKGISVSGYGAVAMIVGVGYIAGSLGTGGRLGRFDLRVLCAVSTAAMAFMLMLVYTLPFGIWPVVPLMPAVGFLAGMGWVALTTLLAGETPAAPGTTMVFNGSVFNFGSGLGSLIGGRPAGWWRIWRPWDRSAHLRGHCSRPCLVSRLAACSGIRSSNLRQMKVTFTLAHVG